ncbi:MAG TPA: precorrin-6y C5,15-methyltransferase (decarboxylating) subunit CbiE [Acetobacteraceae bacterium]|nr:precorrin-6y C5,15-methyltransferase (decarboxylating) subunit CbiE [Acetobacteraceae bacterium]
MTKEHWLSILGIGEDGVEGLSAAARGLLADAGLVVGGARHLGLAATLIRGETMAWPSPIHDAFPAILARRGERVAVVASGDPFWHGIGSRLAPLLAPEEYRCLPAASCASLAAAKLGWALHETPVISCCGLPVARLVPHLHPGARLFVLSAGAETPGDVATLLRARGFGPSRLHVLEALGGPRERHRQFDALVDPPDAIAALNMLAIELRAAAGARIVPRAPGLPDEDYAHDGQITKREIRSQTIAALAPSPGEILWDIGCGSGSIAIEWMLSHPVNRAIGIEREAARAERARGNALALGVPALDVRLGEAPEALAGLAAPDAVFIGGGARRPGLIRACWDALPPGGRIVANAVTIETEAILLAVRATHGGTVSRLAVERLDAIGALHAFRPAMSVTQWRAVKPCR